MQIMMHKAHETIKHFKINFFIMLYHDDGYTRDVIELNIC